MTVTHYSPSPLPPHHFPSYHLLSSQCEHLKKDINWFYFWEWQWMTDSLALLDQWQAHPFGLLSHSDTNTQIDRNSYWEKQPYIGKECCYVRVMCNWSFLGISSVSFPMTLARREMNLGCLASCLWMVFCELVSCMPVSWPAAILSSTL